MKVNEFLVAFQDVLQTEEELSLDTELETLEEWDSLAIMSTMAFLEANFGVSTTMVDYEQMKTIGDIAQKAGVN